VESLPFDGASFDAVVSQFCHMFGSRHAITTSEMLRVLRPGGVIAFSTWPPELFTGRMFKFIGGYLPPSPAGASSPVAWGNPNIVRQYLGDPVTNISFDRNTSRLPGISPAHVRLFMGANAGPVSRLVESLADDVARLAQFREEFESLVSIYFEDNVVRQDYLMSRATKV
jgi:SAM-dependent methyltransferase